MNCTVIYDGQAVKFLDVDPSDEGGAIIALGTFCERPILDYIRKLGIKGNYVDAGANFGNHTLFFSLFCPSVHVYSFEPQPLVFKKLEANLKVNGVPNRAYRLALSDQPSRGNFFSSDPANNGRACYHPGSQTKIKRLDKLGLRDIKLMKIDVEGMELKVLRGAEETLKTTEHLFLEMRATHVLNDEERSAREQLLSFLDERGFKHEWDYEIDQVYYFKRQP